MTAHPFVICVRPALPCVCLAGTRSAYAAALLRQQGIEAANLAGGMLEWQSEQLPITPPGIIAAH